MVRTRTASLAATVALVFAAGVWTTAEPQGTPAGQTYVTPKTARPLIYTSKEKIDEGFAKNELMLHESEGLHYMVESAQRSKPGSPEVHLKDTDVAYVVKGAATLTAGGTVEGIVTRTEGRPGDLHPEYELRGGKIVGGTTYHLKAGDSIVIPPGIPHCFCELSSVPFYYLNIKVRAD
ncbi:MAG: cupin domain-containing protein [Acidobacteriota bacterium]